MKKEIKKIETIDDVKEKVDYKALKLKYKYQKELTPKLDVLEADFNQEIINEIVLWKVNRYALIDEETLRLLNKIKKTDTELDEDLTKQILERLLEKDQKGIQLAMASTILRFKNPKIYQIIDQRVYRFIYGNEMEYSTSIDKQIKRYLEYLELLTIKCDLYKIPFEEADRVFYEADKEFNKDIPIKY